MYNVWAVINFCAVLDLNIYSICANPPNRHSETKLAKIFFGAHLSDKFLLDLYTIYYEKQ